MKILIFFILAMTVIVLQGQAFETGCSLQPKDLNKYATGVTKILAARKEALPKTIPLQSDFQFSSKNGAMQYYGTFEGFFRPENDDFFSIIPIPILGFDVTKDRVVLYLCAHYSSNKDDSHMTIYFLRGYHIDPPKLSNFVGDLFYDPQLKIKAVPATLLGIGEIKMFFIQIFRYIPFVDVYFETFSLVQRFLANTLGDVTGLGVERIELTEKYVRVSSGVDLESPRNARISKTFTLNRPNLGDGAKKSFQADDNKVLSDLNSGKIDYSVTDDNKPGQNSP